MPDQPSSSPPSGIVRKDIFIRVLRHFKVTVVCNGNECLISKGGKPEYQVLPDFVPRKLVARYSNKYNIDAHFFYHPEALPPEAQSPT